MSSSASSTTEGKLGEAPVVQEMGRNTDDDSTLRPTWFTPGRLLVIFCVINMVNYVDRGAMASNGVNGSRRSCTSSGICSSGSGIQGDFNLNNFEDGVLSSAFMVGLLVASPVFASLAKTHNPFRLIGVGLSVWTFATACCGASFSFWSIAVFRMLVGVGEASFISLAAPYIDDNAPVSSRTAWLAIFYMCIPAGVALGYVYGGLVGSHLHWRWAFWGESILMFPFAVFGFVVKPLQLKGFRSLDHSEESDAASSVVVDGSHESSEGTTTTGLRNQVLSFFKDLKVLLTDPVYVVNVLGYVAYNFVIGAYSYWGPKAGYNIYRMSDADLTFGGITILCGVLGTLGGGYTLDRISATISNAFKLLAAASFFGAAFCFSAFCLKNMYGFIALFSVGELFVFATQAPVNYVCLHCVSPSLRPLSMAVSTVAIHVFGDVPSSPLVGILQDKINNWRESALILTSILFLAALIWSVGALLNGVDKVANEETGNGSCCTLRAKMAPLLEESGSAGVHEPRSLE